MNKEFQLLNGVVYYHLIYMMAMTTITSAVTILLVSCVVSILISASIIPISIFRF